MRAIPFTKMSGVGNDFIIVDNRAGILNEIGAARICAPGLHAADVLGRR